jgi:hypothetical protein
VRAQHEKNICGGNPNYIRSETFCREDSIGENF